MSAPPLIFDRALLRARLDRAAPGYANADFLKRRAAEDAVVRLEAIMRDFPVAVDLGARTGAFRNALASSDVAARVGLLVEADLAPAMLAGRTGARTRTAGGAKTTAQTTEPSATNGKALAPKPGAKPVNPKRTPVKKATPAKQGGDKAAGAAKQAGTANGAARQVSAANGSTKRTTAKQSAAKKQGAADAAKRTSG